MKSIFTRWKWLQIIEGALLLVFGLVLAICCWMPNFNSFIGIVIGIFILLDAALFMLMPLFARRLEFDTSILVGGALMGVAILLFILPQLVVSFLPLLVGSVLCASSLYFLAKGIKDVQAKLRPSIIAFNFSIFALALALGITFIVLGIIDNSQIANILLTIVGAAIALAGLMLIITSSIALAREKQKK